MSVAQGELRGLSTLKSRLILLQAQLLEEGDVRTRWHVAAPFFSRMLVDEMGYAKSACLEAGEGVFACPGGISWLDESLWVFDPENLGNCMLSRVDPEGECWECAFEPRDPPGWDLDAVMGHPAAKGNKVGLILRTTGHEMVGIIALATDLCLADISRLQFFSLRALTHLVRVLLEGQGNKALEEALNLFFLSRLELAEEVLARERERNAQAERELERTQAIIADQLHEVEAGRKAIDDALASLRQKTSEVEIILGEKVVLESQARKLLESQERSWSLLREVEAANREYHILFSILRHSYGNMMARLNAQRMGVAATMSHLDAIIVESGLKSRTTLAHRLLGLEPETIDRFIDDFVRHFTQSHESAGGNLHNIDGAMKSFLLEHRLYQDLESLAHKDMLAMSLGHFVSMAVKRMHQELLHRVGELDRDQQRLDDYLNRVFTKLVNGQASGKGSCDVIQVANELLHKCRKMYRADYKGTIQFEFLPLSSVPDGVRIGLDEPTFIIDVFNNLLRNALAAAITQDGSSSRGLVSGDQLAELLDEVPELRGHEDLVFKPWTGEGSLDGTWYQIVEIFEILPEEMVDRAMDEVFAEEVERPWIHARTVCATYIRRFRYVLSPAKLAWILDRSLRDFGEPPEPGLSARILESVLCRVCADLISMGSGPKGNFAWTGEGLFRTASLVARTLAARRHFWLSVEVLSADDGDLVEIRVGDNIIGIPNDWVVPKFAFGPDLQDHSLDQWCLDQGKRYLVLRNHRDEILDQISCDPDLDDATRTWLLESMLQAEPRKKALFKGYMSTTSDMDIEAHGKGLLTVARISSEAGGTIAETGTWGKGAEFVLRLPRLPSIAPHVSSELSQVMYAPGLGADEDDPAVMQAARTLSGKRILVVEDSADLARHMCGLLERNGKARTMVAGSVSGAVRQLAGHPYDLMTLDLDLGDSYGVDLLHAIQSGRLEMPPKAVMIVSTHVHDRYIREICEDYPIVQGLLAKPFTDRDLILAAGKILEPSIYKEDPALR